jgi:hypothetical protein
MLIPARDPERLQPAVASRSRLRLTVPSTPRAARWPTVPNGGRGEARRARESNASIERRICPMNQSDLREELIATDEEYRRLYQEHQDYERRLDELIHRSLLSQDDEIEEKRIKLHKLALKDRMEAIVRSQAEQRVAV